MGVPALASAEGTPQDASAAPLAVEDFAYPGTSPFPALKLFRGDGHIVLADCSGATQIKLYSRAVGSAGPAACFRVTGPTGHLTLELPQTFIVQTVEYAVSARLTNDVGLSTTVDVPSNTMQNVAEGLGQKPAALVELRVGRTVDAP
ncbi:hypothetical protein [Kitasatospora sp. NPDC059327]|uniref:hypothetical protein n=1 Tax=Kitasatospora sp. NPDC059327 TaxID=3346803 RepID=UPI0036833118